MAQVENQAKYRLGLDMGTNSIGWAAIELDENGAPSGILDMGVRIFPDGRNPRDEASNAVQRRVARGQRRRRDRYIKRRKDLINALVEYGLMPKWQGRAQAHSRRCRAFRPIRSQGACARPPAQTIRAWSRSLSPGPATWIQVEPQIG